MQAINEFAGAVVLVSHDWHLLELVADRLWLVADGTVRPFDGDLDDYRRLVLERAEPAASEAPPRPTIAGRRGGVRPKSGASSTRCGSALARPRRRIARLSQEREALDRGLAAFNGARPPGSPAGDALKRRAELVRLIAQAENRMADDRGSDRTRMLVGRETADRVFTRSASCMAVLHGAVTAQRIAGCDGERIRAC